MAEVAQMKLEITHVIVRLVMLEDTAREVQLIYTVYFLINTYTFCSLVVFPYRFVVDR